MMFRLNNQECHATVWAHMATGILVLALLASADKALAAGTITGRVTEVRDNAVKVKTDGEWLPTVGDRAEIYLEIPGVPEGAAVAEGKVTAVADNAISVKVDRMFMVPERNHLVRITSEKPQKKTKAAATDTPPPPKTPSGGPSAGPAITPPAEVKAPPPKASSGAAAPDTAPLAIAARVEVRPALQSLAGKTFRFSGKSSQASGYIGTLALGKDGTISGSPSPNETFWLINGEGRLVFKHRDGRISTVFTQAEQRGGLWLLSGPFQFQGGVLHLLEEIPEGAMTDPAQLLKMGNDRSSQRRFAEARLLYEQATRLQPNSAEVWLALARTENWLGNLDGAIAAYEAALRLAPQTPNIRGWLGEICVHKGDYPAAFRWLNEEVTANPRNAWAHSLLGTLGLRTGNSGNRDRGFSTATSLDPNIAVARFQNGQFLQNERQHGRALTEFASAAAMNPRLPGPFYCAGTCCVVLGQKQAAIQWFERYLTMETTGEWADRARQELARLRQQP